MPRLSLNDARLVLAHLKTTLIAQVLTADPELHRVAQRLAQRISQADEEHLPKSPCTGTGADRSSRTRRSAKKDKPHE